MMTSASGWWPWPGWGVALRVWMNGAKCWTPRSATIRAAPRSICSACLCWATIWKTGWLCSMRVLSTTPIRAKDLTRKTIRSGICLTGRRANNSDRVISGSEGNQAVTVQCHELDPAQVSNAIFQRDAVDTEEDCADFEGQVRTPIQDFPPIIPHGCFAVERAAWFFRYCAHTG